MEIGDGMDNNITEVSPGDALVMAIDAPIAMQCDTVPKRSMMNDHSSSCDLPSDILPCSGVPTNDITFTSRETSPVPAAMSQCSPLKNATSACKTMSDSDSFDSSLLHQFSCLGTRDHDDLIEQFHILMNNQMSKDAARFFLEMSNWNLQTAVGCFLDFYNGQKLPSMKILHQSQPNSRQVLWRIQNDGTESWPNGCYLISSNQLQRIEVPSIKPGESCEVVASICPTDAIVWRLCAPHGEYFGDHLCLTTLNSFNASSSSDELNQRLAQMAVSDREQIGGPAVHNYPQINIVISEQME